MNRNKCLPQLFVVGPQKCGTTTVFGLLRQHPGVFLPEQKETHHFACDGKPLDFTDRGAEQLNATAVWRREDYEALYADAPATSLKVEVCPSYIYSPVAAEAIAAAVPDAKVVAILRNPVQRSFSAYRFSKLIGSETAPTFEKALELEEQHMRDNWQPLSHYLAGSVYAPQLERLYRFFPRENVLVEDFADLKRDPIATTNRILAFAGAPPLPQSVKLAQTNKTVEIKSDIVRRILVHRGYGIADASKIIPQRLRSKARELLLAMFSSSDEKLREDTKARLVDYFAADREQVQAMTNKDFSNWKS